MKEEKRISCTRTPCPSLTIARPSQVKRSMPCLDASDHTRSLSIELRSVAIMRFLLAVFESIALVVLEQSVLPTVVTFAEATVANDSLRALLAVLVCAADLLGWHAAAQWCCEVHCRLLLDVAVRQRTR